MDLGQATSTSNSHIRELMLLPDSLRSSAPIIFSSVISTVLLFSQWSSPLYLSSHSFSRRSPVPCRRWQVVILSHPSRRFLISATVQVPYEAVYNPQYENPNLPLKDVACSELASKYATLINISYFPNVGGAPDTTYNSPNCGAIWKIVNKDTGAQIYSVGIDYSSGFDLSANAFVEVGGDRAKGSVQVEALIYGYIPV